MARPRKSYTAEFKVQAVRLITDQKLSVAGAARRLVGRRGRRTGARDVDRRPGGPRYRRPARARGDGGRGGAQPPRRLRTAVAADRGRIAPALLADIIAVAGNPLENIRVLEDVRFVMKDGKVYKQPAPIVQVRRPST